MSFAVVAPPSTSIPTKHRRSKAKPSRDQHHLHTLISDAQALYTSSQFAKTIDKHLTSLTRSTPITRILSLGLGSLSAPEKGQSRRIKQLAILLEIRSSLQKTSHAPVQVYAQDPTFTRADEALLSTLDIRIARTSSGSSLGEAEDLIDVNTIVYSPFLTLEAYEQLFVRSKAQVQYLIGDDFNALLEKWPKYSAERAQVEKLVKSALGRYRRRAISGEGFWDEADGAFPMAGYAVQSGVRERAKI